MSEQNRQGNGPLGEEHDGGDHGGVRQARERFSRLAGQVRDFGRGAAPDREALRQGYRQAEERARVLSGDVNDFVQEHPGRAVLIAAGIGFLIGVLVRRAGD